ncbi:MAG TPA: archease [Firmicutes bacterium]|nr:archease [Bacillota bacterium]
MSWELFEHTADIGLRAFGVTLEEAFAEAARGTLSLIAPSLKPRPLHRTDLAVSARDLESLLVAWLSEILYLLYAEGFFPAVIDVLQIRGEPAGKNTPESPDQADGHNRVTLDAELTGEVLAGERRDKLELEVKAVTYHMLEIEKRKQAESGKEWFVQVILDV